MTGSVTVVSDGGLGGVLRFDLPGGGVAGVGASPPVRDALFPARREGGESAPPPRFGSGADGEGDWR